MPDKLTKGGKGLECNLDSTFRKNSCIMKHILFLCHETQWKFPTASQLHSAKQHSLGPTVSSDDSFISIPKMQVNLSIFFSKLHSVKKNTGESMAPKNRKKSHGIPQNPQNIAFWQISLQIQRLTFKGMGHVSWWLDGPPPPERWIRRITLFMGPDSSSHGSKLDGNQFIFDIIVVITSYHVPILLYKHICHSHNHTVPSVNQWSHFSMFITLN